MKLSKKGWDSLVKEMNHHLCSIKVEALIPNSLNGKKCLQKAKDEFIYLPTYCQSIRSWLIVESKPLSGRI